MSNDLNLALANAALAISSGWTLALCSDLKFARFGFGLYLVDSVLGVIEYLLPHSNSTVTKAHDVVGRVARPLYLPLIAAEAIVFGAGMQVKYSYCHLIIPGIYLTLTELLKKNVKKDILDLSTIINAVSLCFSSYKKEDVYGGVCALVNLAAFMAAKEKSMEFLLLVGIANLTAAQFFKQALL